MSDEGFLHRWSRRKMQGDAAPPEELRPAAAQQQAPADLAPEAPAASLPAARQGEGAPQAGQEAQAPPPTLEDAQALTPESDFKPFMARTVAPEVRNAAMKKLFADPHFNVMDRMDVYIDDYSNPAPLLPAQLRKMASAAFLKLVDDDEEKNKAPLEETPAMTQAQDVAQSEHHAIDPSPPAAMSAEVPQPASQETDDDHADLRLQQDDAAGAEDPRRGAS